MKVFELHQVVSIPRGIDEVFGFFADATNLTFLTPDWLDFRILTETPVRMRTGTEIRYQIRLHGIPLRWTSRIGRWDPPHVFVDEQLRGPYRKWIHEHRFVPGGGGTRVEDHIRYSVWGGGLVNRLVVEPDLRRIFEFRTRRLLGRFE